MHGDLAEGQAGVGGGHAAGAAAPRSRVRAGRAAHPVVSSVLTKTPPESVTSPTRSRSRARVGDVDHETDDGPVEAGGDEVAGRPRR